MSSLYLYRKDQHIIFTIRDDIEYDNVIFFNSTAKYLVLAELIRLHIGDRLNTWYPITEPQWLALLDFVLDF